MLDTGRLDRITTFPALLEYLRDQLDWPIEEYSFEDLTYEWDPKEFGLKADELGGQVEIKQLRPIEREPWGIFFLSLPHRKVPVTVLRRILGHLAVKKRASANAGSRAAWDKGDLLFIAAHGADAHRGLAFAHFHEDKAQGDLPTLNLLGWDGGDTVRRLSATHEMLRKQLHWRDSGEGDDQWRARWAAGFREKPGEVVATSKGMAKELARLAREIRRRANELLHEENDSGPLRTLHKAFKEALIHDLKYDDFADMYAQTIAYGLLSARISRESGALVADSAADLAPPTNPFLKELLETFLKAGGRKGGMDFDELGVHDVVEMLRRANMEAVLRDFDDRNPNEDPVIHFYELFLKEYDAKKRMQRGVFYTPRPVVSFIVRAVDEVLRAEFGLEDGLASTATWDEVIAAKPEISLPEGAKGSDPFVRILDPATGTGTFLVETIGLIHERMTAKWRKEGKRDPDISVLWNDYVPRHLLPRLYGFELMMAPYAIAHMKLGLKLYETGYRFGSDERARIYLTNALEPAQDFDLQLAFMSEALAHEAVAANAAKKVRFTAVVGNPPYANFGMQNRFPWILAKLADYKRDLNEKKVNLDDDFIKFIRLFQHLLSESGTGVASFISNNTYLDGITHRQMRKCLLDGFTSLSVIDLHGSAAKREKAPDGSNDENVFDIQQGVGIGIFTASPGRNRSQPPEVCHADLWGARDSKYNLLSSGMDVSGQSHRIEPGHPFWFFVPKSSEHDDEYARFVRLTDLFGINGPGLKAERDAVAIHKTPEGIQEAVQDFRTLPDAELRAKYDLGKDARDWTVAGAKLDVRSRTDEALFTPIQYRPFDIRFTWFSGKTRGFIGTPGTPTMRNMIPRGNVGLLSMRQYEYAVPEYCYIFASADVVDNRIFVSNRGMANIFPLWVLAPASDRLESNMTGRWGRHIAQLIGCAYVPDLAAVAVQRDCVTPADLFGWIYAILHSRSYRLRYAEQLKQGFPRIPLPGSRELFQRLVPLGTRLVALHLLDAEAAPDLEDPKEVRFAGHGEARVERAPAWSAPSGGRVSISSGRWFEGVPERVWNLHVGGYQPAQKWLKDRAKKGGKKASPGRILTAEDQLHYRRMIVAMDRTIDAMAEIDRIIDEHGGWPAAFKGVNEEEI